MAICLLVRHGRTRANAEGLLAGWTPGIGLDEVGQAQAAKVADRLSHTGVVAVVSSPLQRCQQTATAISARLDPLPGAGAGAGVETDDRLGEARYGSWTGRALKDLAEEPLWRRVQDRPSSVTYPPDERFGSESMVIMQSRVVAALQDWDARVEAEHGPAAVWVAVSHGDPIKAALADALGSSLDDFQRIVVDPASLSIVHRTSTRPFVLRTNDTGTDPVDLGSLRERLASQPTAVGDAAVGGGAGDAASH